METCYRILTFSFGHVYPLLEYLDCSHVCLSGSKNLSGEEFACTGNIRNSGVGINVYTISIQNKELCFFELSDSYFGYDCKWNCDLEKWENLLKTTLKIIDIQYNNIKDSFDCVLIWERCPYLKFEYFDSCRDFECMKYFLKKNIPVTVVIDVDFLTEEEETAYKKVAHETVEKYLGSDMEKYLDIVSSFLSNKEGFKSFGRLEILDSILKSKPSIVSKKKYSETLSEISLSFQELINLYPPEFISKVKLKIYEKAWTVHHKQEGMMNVFRVTFSKEKLDEIIEFCKTGHSVLIEQTSDFFSYESDMSDEYRKVWYLNFSDRNLFGYYGGNLFAQDEIQTLEHPLLCSVREYLLKNKIQNMRPITKDENIPTPFLFENVPYWVYINTNPILQDGRKVSLYGHNFKTATQDEIDAGIKILEEEFCTNIISLAALSGGHGPYTKTEIEYTLSAVLCAFEQAKIRSGIRESIIHTGNWGCGVFGGNKEFMYLVQLIGADCTGIRKIVFHNVDADILGRARLKFMRIKSMTFSSLVMFLYEQNYNWNSGDGN